MYKSIRKILPLLLCLLLFACLLPAAYANTEISGNTLQELKDAISAYNQDSTEKVDFYTSGSFTITEDVTIPDGFRLRVSNNDVLTVAADAVVTVNGKLDVKDDGYIDILGKVVNYGQVRMFDAGVIHAGGTLENRSWICYEHVNPYVKHLVVDKKENLQIFGPLAVYDGVSPTESVLGVPVDNWCIRIPKDEPEVSLYMILTGLRPEDNSSSGRYSYIEIRGTEAYTLVKDMTVPAGTEVVMNNIVLTVPTGMTLTVNGELIVKNLVVEDGGNVVTGEGGSITYRTDVTTLAELKAELNAGTSRIIVTEDITLDADLTIPESCYVKVRHGSKLTVPAGKTLTINGKIEASFNGRIDVVGTLQNNGQIEMFDGGVVDVKGTYAHANGKPIVFNKDGREDAVNPTLIVEQGANCTLNLFRTDEGLTSEDVIEGFDVSAYCYHRNYDRDNHVIRELRVYYPSWMAGIMDMEKRAIGYLEIHNLDTFTLFGDAEIPVYDDITPAWVDMSETTLVVPSGMTLTVNGVLIVKDLVVEDGGNVVIGDGGSITYADRIDVTTLAELKAELSAGTSRIIVTEDITLDADLTIPESCYVKVRHGSKLTVPAGKTLTINGKIEASFNGRIDVVGTLQNNGQIEMFDGGVVDVKGTYAHANGKPIVFNKDGREDAVNPTLIVEQGANCTLNLFRTDEGLTSEDVIEGFDVSAYCYHRNYDRDNHVIRELRVYYPSWMAGIMDMEKRAIGYLEIHNLDTFTLFGDAVIPVFDGTTPAKVDMSETTLVVPSGMTLTVNGVLIVKDLVVEDGGTVVKGPNGSITYAAGSDIEALRDAIADPAISQFEVSGNPFTITEALTIPSDFTVIVGSGSSLEIPAGVALNLKGRLILREGAVLNVLQTSGANRGRIIGGTLEVDAGSTINLMGRLEINKLRLDGTLTTQNSGVWYEFELTDLVNGRPRGRMIISNGGSHSVSSNGLDEAKLQEWVSFEGDQAYLEIAYRVKSDQDLTEMTQRIRNLPARFQGTVRLHYGAVIRDDYIFPGIQIRVDGSSGGSLTIAEGAVLTAPTVYLKDAELTVNGTFISIPRDNNHNGAVMLQGNTSRLTVTDTGIIGGTDCTIEINKEITDPEACLDGVKFSQLQDISDPIRAAAGFLTYRFIPELSLPAALNTIESEAFAGGSFSSVYIPAGVTSIAPDAFGDMTGLKVYGEYGTAAETFADGHFPFAPLVWRGNQ